jgi:hypothetical protein
MGDQQGRVGVDREYHPSCRHRSASTALLCARGVDVDADMRRHDGGGDLYHRGSH